MMRINKIPNWNGLLHGRESCLVYLKEEFEINDVLFQRWHAIYDINKKLQELNQSPVNDKRFNFLRNQNDNFVFVDFIASKVNLDEDNSEIYLINSEYFLEVEDFKKFFLNKKIKLEIFKLAWKIEYPLGI